MDESIERYGSCFEYLEITSAVVNPQYYITIYVYVRLHVYTRESHWPYIVFVNTHFRPRMTREANWLQYQCTFFLPFDEWLKHVSTVRTHSSHFQFTLFIYFLIFSFLFFYKSTISLATAETGFIFWFVCNKIHRRKS